MDASGKYVRYTNEQVEALERVYHECPKPSSIRRQQLIREAPVLANIEPKQIKVWFQNRRCREKQRKESTRLVSVNAKLTALNRLLMEENERLARHTSQLTLDNHMLRQQLNELPGGPAPPPGSRRRLPNNQEGPPLHGLKEERMHGGNLFSALNGGGGGGGDKISSRGDLSLQVPGRNGMASTDTSSDSVITVGLPQNPTPQHSPRDVNSAGLLALAEDTLTEFLAKATGTAVDWIQLPGMKPGPDAIGIIAISHGCAGIAARACGLVGLEPTKVAEVLKDRPSWLRDCRRLQTLGAISTGKGGTIELLYTQMYAPTTLAPPRDFCTLRYTTILEDGNLVICERSLAGSQEPMPSFVRAEMLPSGFLIRPCEGGGCIIHVVDHYDLEPWSIPEVLRPLYESAAALAQRMTIRALRYLRRLAQEESGEIGLRNGQQHPGALWTLSQRLARGFNEAVNTFTDDGWTTLGSDGMDDVSILMNPTPTMKSTGGQNASDRVLFALGGGILCAKASMLLQNVPPALLIRSLREHRSEWANFDIDANTAATFRNNLHGGISASRAASAPLPFAHSLEQEEFLEVVKLEGGSILSRDSFLVQLCSGIDENAVGACAQLVFAPVDVAISDDVPLLPSGFRVIPLDSNTGLSRTLNLAATLEGGSDGMRTTANGVLVGSASSHSRSVLTIAFQFAYEAHNRDSCAVMAREYVRTVVASVQQIAMALTPSHLAPHTDPRHLPGTPNSLLARRIVDSYRVNLGMDLTRTTDTGNNDALFKDFWQHNDAIVCCTWKGLPEFMFANRAGLEMFETTAGALQDLSWENTLDENSKKFPYTDFTQVLQQGYAYLPPGVRISHRGRTVTYERALAWKVTDVAESPLCVAFLFMNWTFLT
ncbi:unnamed protein product [Sphagnum compactum]